jgi:hypothetical protein
MEAWYFRYTNSSTAEISAFVHDDGGDTPGASGGLVNLPHLRILPTLSKSGERGRKWVVS